MNSFGLGLVLTFVDNASPGMNSASQTFNQMSVTADNLTSAVSTSATEMTAIAYSLGSVGDSFISVGSSILGVFSNITQQVIDSGMSMQGYRMQLSALYGSVEAGEAKIEEIKQYAMNSVFDIQSLIPAVTMMKTVGIEAMQEVTTSSGNATQRLLDYASDIAAMVPNMRNVYGTGVAAAMGALKEYIAEGNALTLKRGAGLDITAILGEDKGASIEERTQQVADLVEKLNIVGYTANLAGTPTQRLSNMQDALFNSLTKIADSGVFEVYCGLLEKLSNWVFSLVEDEETFNAITGVLADTISTLLSPLESMLDWIIENSNALIGWIKEHPKLTKGILLTVAAIGAILVVGGSLLKFLSTISFALSGLQVIKTLPVMLSSLGSAFVGLMIKALPIVALASLLYIAWKDNLFGLRDLVKNTFDKIVTTFSLVFDAWGDYTLSEENFLKARDLGLLPLIETLLDLKYRFDFFKQGFVEGWKEIASVVTGAMLSVGSALKGSVFQPIIDKISEFFTNLSGSNTQAWYDFGKSFSKFVAVGSGVIALISTVSKIIPLVTKIGSAVKGLFGLISAHPVIAIIIAVVAALVLLYTKCEWFRDFVNSVFSELSSVFSDVFGSVKEVVTSLFAQLGPVLKQFIERFKEFLPQILSFLQRTGAFVSQLIAKVAELVMRLLPSIIKIVGTIFEVILRLLPVVFDLLESVFKVLTDLIFPVICDLVDMLIPFIVEVVEILADLIDAILPIIVSLLEDIMPVITNLLDMIVPMLKDIIDALLPVIGAILTIVTDVLSYLVPALESIFVIVAEIIKCVVNIVAPIIKVIVQIVQVILTILLPIIEAIIVVLGVVIDVVMGIVNIVLDVIEAIIVVITGIINVIMGIIDVIVQAIMTVVGVIVGIVRGIIETIVGIINGIVYAVKAVWNGIVSAFSGCIDFFSGLFSEVSDTITGIFQGVGDFITGVWNGLVSGASEAWEGIKSIFSAVAGFFSNIFSTAWEAVVSVFSTTGQVFLNIGTGILEAFKTVVNAIITGINTVIALPFEGLNGVLDLIEGIEIAGIKPFDWLDWRATIPEIPQLAHGGVLTKPTLNVAGEAGAEAVVPLKNNTEWMVGLASILAPMLLREQSGYTSPQMGTVVTNTVSTNNYTDSHDSSTQLLTSNTSIVGGNTSTNNSKETHNDYSVTFEAGSIVIQLSGTSDADLEKVADKLMKIIARKQQLKAMALRQ